MPDWGHIPKLTHLAWGEEGHTTGYIDYAAWLVDHMKL